MEQLDPNGLVDAIEEVFEATIELASHITQQQAGLPTECPGWTVQDQLAHMVGLEQVLAGAPEPNVDLGDLDHVDTEFDAFMEATVHIRRPLPFCAVADELTGFAPRRIAQLRELVEQGDPKVPGPFGERRLSAALPIRVFDLWAHEQDIRRAIGDAPRITGLAAEISMSRSLLGWTMGLAKAHKDVDGVVTIQLEGPKPSATVLTLGHGGPEMTIRGDLGQLTRAFCGRGEPDRSLLSGDDGLVAALHAKLAFTP